MSWRRRAWPRGRVPRGWWLVVALALALGLVACGGAGEDSAPSAGSAAAPERAGDAAGTVQGEPVDPTREIIYTARLEIRTGDVDAAADRAADLAGQAGGFVFSSQSRREPEVRASLVLKVPPDEFQAVLDGLRGLGDVQSETTEAEDVSEQVVDLESRIASGQASVERLRELLAEARSVSDVVAIESELASREADLESLQGQLRVLRAQVDLATITVAFTQPSEPRVEDLPGFVRGLRTGVVAFINFIQALLTVIGVLLPFAVFFGLIAGLVVWLVRRRRARRPPAAPRWPPVPPGTAPDAGPAPPVPEPPPARVQEAGAPQTVGSPPERGSERAPPG